MKNKINLLGIIAILAMIGFGLAACEPEPDPCASCLKIGSTGESGGKIIYHDHAGFNVAGLGTCYYLEAAPVNQGSSVSWSSTNIDVTSAKGTTIGTGKANTTAIITAHSGDSTSTNAAKAAAAYNGGGKNDWFLPSKDELYEMYKAKTHLGISSGFFWSSSQLGSDDAWGQYFDIGDQSYASKDFSYSNLIIVRAVRAF